MYFEMIQKKSIIEGSVKNGKIWVELEVKEMKKREWGNLGKAFLIEKDSRRFLVIGGQVKKVYEVFEKVPSKVVPNATIIHLKPLPSGSNLDEELRKLFKEVFSEFEEGRDLGGEG
jgi:hypothetical protein